MIRLQKTAQDILREEMLRERVGTLARMAERLEEALERLHELDREITAEMARFTPPDPGGTDERAPGGTPGWEKGGGRGRLREEINRKIRAFNKQREYARTRYFYLIVTREALGIIHHERLDDFYRIPPKRACLPDR